MRKRSALSMAAEIKEQSELAREARSEQCLARRIVACAGGLRFGPACGCARCKLKEMDDLKTAFRDKMSRAAGELGDWMRRARTASGLSLRTVAVAAGVSAAFLSDVELGRRTPTKETLARLLKAVGADAPSDEAQQRGRTDA